MPSEPARERGAASLVQRRLQLQHEVFGKLGLRQCGGNQVRWTGLGCLEAAARAHLVLVRVDLLSRLSKPSELERVAEVVGHRQW